jgi:putative SOS response-associated peptidase YedK
MCGRFTLRTPATVLIEHFDLDVRADKQLPLFEPRYNIAPTQDVVVVRADATNGLRTASMMRWGLLPAWSKGVASGPPMINARSETLAEKPAFRSAFRSRRCLIPADGFYEWQQSISGAKGKKQPFWIHRPDGEPFAFAGLWEKWRDPSAELAIESCTIVTTAANSSLSYLHDRMPVILAPGDYSLWLDSKVDEPGKLQHLLEACGNDELVAEPVSIHVNRVANDDARCIEAERTLF